MTLNPHGRPVPERLVADQFVLHRQRPSDTALDYAAVMDSRQELREWSDSEWPEDDFTLAANAEDLQMHIGEHERHEAYGYSIFAPDEQRLIGSLYVNSVAPLLEFYVVDGPQRAALLGYGARAEYWLRRGTSPDFEQAFLRAIRHWFTAEWWFGGVLLGSRRNMVAQRAAYEAAGLGEVARLTSKDGRRRFHFHALTPQ